MVDPIDNPDFEVRTTKVRRRFANWLLSVDNVLRRRDARPELIPNATLVKQSVKPILRKRQVALMVGVFGALYGAGMGSYAFLSGDRTLFEQLPQIVFSAVKVPLLIAVTLLVSLPSFFVINTLLGLRDDFVDALKAIISAQAGLMVILASFLPITLFVYHSVAAMRAGYATAVLFNAAMFGIASVSAQVLLRAYYRELVRKNIRHRWMIRFWICVYAFVGIQAAYVLRPFIGQPGLEPSFFRRESFENAYVRIFELVCNVLFGN